MGRSCTEVTQQFATGDQTLRFAGSGEASALCEQGIGLMNSKEGQAFFLSTRFSGKQDGLAETEASIGRAGRVSDGLL